MEPKNKNQARLRLVKSEHLDLCSSLILTAASPLGAVVRPVSMSLTAEGDSPTSSPMAMSVIPMERRSEMREDHVCMTPNIRHTVDSSQRLPVTEFRNNPSMPKPPGMPGKNSSVGQRVRFWRKIRGYKQKDFAKEVDYSQSGLSDLENDHSGASEKLHLIAAKLRLNPHYLETGDGEPESDYPQEPPPATVEWPFPAVPPSKLKRYNKIEVSFIQTQIIQAMNEIESERRNKSG